MIPMQKSAPSLSLAPQTPAPVVVTEVALPRHHRPAYLVRPVDKDRDLAGVLWLHWLGNERSDRSEFLGEAVELARLGVVSLLPQGQFPWTDEPNGTLLDREAVGGELRRTAAAFRHLTSEAGVDPGRTAVVGHDYGAMFALAGRAFGARAVVAVAPDRAWDPWFVRYWLDGRSSTPGYRASFADVDPVAGAVACQDRLFLQWAQHDEYLEADVPTAYADAAPLARATSYRRRDHRLGGDPAVRDRRAFLVERLGISR